MAHMKLQNPEDDIDELYALACGPNMIVKKYQGCIDNEVRFHTIKSGIVILQHKTVVSWLKVTTTMMSLIFMVSSLTSLS